MDIYSNMKKVIRLTESDLVRLVKKVINEQDLIGMANQILNGFGDSNTKVKKFCDLCKKSKAQPHPRSTRFADAIRDAVQGVGTDEESIYHVFDSLSQQVPDGKKFDEFCSLVKTYQKSYNVDLYTDLSSDISDESEWVRIMRPIRDLLIADRMSSGDARPLNQTTSTPKSPTKPFPRTTTNPASKMPVR
jgi:hypothetical protein